MDELGAWLGADVLTLHSGALVFETVAHNVRESVGLSDVNWQPSAASLGSLRVPDNPDGPPSPEPEFCWDAVCPRRLRPFSPMVEPLERPNRQLEGGLPKAWRSKETGRRFT